MLKAILLLKAHSFKAQLEYPANFLVSVVSISLIGFLHIPSLLILLSAFGNIGGWDFWRLGFMAGLLQMALGLHHALFFSFFDHLWMVKRGEFDRLLVRPLHPILQIMASSLNLSALGEFLPGLVMLLITAHKAQVAWTFPNIAFLAVVVISGAVIEWAVYLFFAAFDFWFGKVGMQWIASAFLNTAPGYPIHIYSAALSFILTFVFPYAFMAYYPTHYFFGIPAEGFPGAFAFLTPLAAILTAALAVAFWSLGLRHYQSTGT